MSALWLSVGLLALVWAGGCRRGVPVVDIGPKPPQARGTITGIVRGPEGTTAPAGRTVEIVNVDTTEKHTAVTGENGGFTIALPAGKYRLDVPLHEGETIVKRPGIVSLDRGDIDSHIEFVLAAIRLTRPHGPGYRVDNGLGSPIG